MKNALDSKLNTAIQWADITIVGNDIFKQGNFSRIDEFFMMVLPVINMSYYQSIRSLDDREYAKEDLIQDTSLALYKDMTIRWDKYIYVDNYGEYIKTMAKNVMLSLVHRYHNYYSTVEYDPDANTSSFDSVKEYNLVETKLSKSQFDKQMLETTRKLASYRIVKQSPSLLQRIITSLYVEKDEDMIELKCKCRILGIHYSTFNLYVSHVKYLYRLVYNYQKALLKGDDKKVSQIEDVMDRFGCDTYKVLVNNYGDTILPEIFAEFGKEATMRFVKTFSGQKVEIPDYRSFCDDLLGASVYSMSDGDKDNLWRLSDEYSLPYRTIARIFDRQVKNKEAMK